MELEARNLSKAQQIFLKVATHLFKQGKMAQKNGGVCLYRGPGSTRCALGILIPDKSYHKEMEGQDAKTVINARLDCSAEVFPWEPLGDLKPYVRLVSALQRIHDDEENWKTSEVMRAALKSVNYCFDLSCTLSVERMQFADR